ncbi:unnamed protein product [Calypogeia fissa]
MVFAGFLEPFSGRTAGRNRNSGLLRGCVVCVWYFCGPAGAETGRAEDLSTECRNLSTTSKPRVHNLRYMGVLVEMNTSQS